MKKAKKENKTLVSFVLDETGSMQTCKQATISGFNEYVESLSRKTKGTVFQLTRFNSEKVDTSKPVPIGDAEKLTDKNYQPDHNTPLYDAIGKTINALGSPRERVLFVIMTDGEENSSQEFTRDSIFKLIKEKEKENWSFVFLGANQDSWETGRSIGLAKGNTANFDTKNMKGAMSSLAGQTVCFCNSASRTTTRFFR